MSSAHKLINVKLLFTFIILVLLSLIHSFLGQYLLILFFLILVFIKFAYIIISTLSLLWFYIINVDFHLFLIDFIILNNINFDAYIV